MSETVSGTVEKINKNKSGFYGILVADTWFGGGKYAPKFSEGDTIQFNWKANGNFKNIDGSVEVLEKGAGSTVPSGVASSGGKATNWDLKDKRITMLACRKDAISLVNIIAEKDALTLPTKKADRMEAILLLVDELTEGLYSKIYSTPYEVE
jgi:hypothetical protein